MPFVLWIDALQCARQGIFSGVPDEYIVMANYVFSRNLRTLATKQGWSWSLHTSRIPSSSLVLVKDDCDCLIMQIHKTEHPRMAFSLNVETFWQDNTRIQHAFDQFCNSLVKEITFILTGTIFEWVPIPEEMHTSYVFNC